jgi:hypothetical protein
LRQFQAGVITPDLQISIRPKRAQPSRCASAASASAVFA